LRRSDSSVVAVDLGGTKIAAARVSARGAIRDRLEEPVDRADVVAQIARIVRALDGGAIGIAVPGLVRRDGTVWAPNLPAWDRVPLAKLIRQKARRPVFVESDRNAAVVGEAWRGAAQGKSDVISLIIGTGIGAGILSGGRIVRGAHELSGCVGWMVVADETNAETPRCGSLEALAAGPAIGGIEAADRARQGIVQAQKAFARAGRLLGFAVANLISVFDPEVIVLTGGLTGAADLYLDELKRAARERAQPLSAPQVDIVITTLGADANLLGVARLASGDTK
jgi:glucokinase